MQKINTCMLVKFRERFCFDQMWVCLEILFKNRILKLYIFCTNKRKKYLAVVLCLFFLSFYFNWLSLHPNRQEVWFKRGGEFALLYCAFFFLLYFYIVFLLHVIPSVSSYIHHIFRILSKATFRGFTLLIHVSISCFTIS